MRSSLFLLLFTLASIHGFSQTGKICGCFKLREFQPQKDSLRLYIFTQKRENLAFYTYVDKNQFNSPSSKESEHKKIIINRNYFICIEKFNRESEFKKYVADSTEVYFGDGWRDALIVYGSFTGQRYKTTDINFQGVLKRRQKKRESRGAERLE